MRSSHRQGCADRAHQRRSEEHTSELQSHLNLVCRLLLEKKKKANGHCTTEANSASHRTPSTFNPAITPPLLSRLKRLTRPTHPSTMSVIQLLHSLSTQAE